MDAGRPAAHSGGQPRPPGAGRPPAREPGMARRHPRQPELLHGRAGAGPRAAAPRVRPREARSSPRCRRSRAPATPACASLDILGNVVPYIGGEEEKMERESRKILGTLGRRRRDARGLRGQRAHQPGADDRRPPDDGVGRVPDAGHARGRDGRAARASARARASPACRPRPRRRSRWMPPRTGRSRGSISSAAGAWR